MANTYDINVVHCIFGTKGRLPLIREPERLWSLLRAVARNSGIELLAVGGTNNHVHLLLKLPKTRTLADAMRELKANSSLRVRRELAAFAWQDGYAAISISPSAITAVTKYITRQQEHHRRKTFEEEYVGILDRAGVRYNTNYVLD
jgi:putative transposase